MTSLCSLTPHSLTPRSSLETHLNTLFITTEGAYLAKDGQAVTVKVEKQVKLRVPLHNLDGIVCFGRVGASPALLGACAEAGVSVSFLSPHGRLRAIVTGFSPGNVLLRREQYRIADDASRCVPPVRAVVSAKLANCRIVLQRGAREAESETDRDALDAAATRLRANLIDVRNADSVDRLRGLEGEAASTYFAALNHLINTEDDTFQYTKRSRRPPLDPLNALLSFVYSLLMHDARSACEAAGLDAAVGFLHRDRPGRPGMALDLMEEFRPVLADRLVLSLINRKQVQAAGFTTRENGAVEMDEATRKTVLSTWQQRKQEELRHPFLEERLTIGLLVHLQARLMARFLRGDLDDYPPFLWK